MPLPDIDFRKIRLHEGSQDRAFEELCCQLAASEPRAADAVFNRKGLGRDGGLECFVRETSGVETGWQVKYSAAVDANLVKSLNASLDAALANHPRLERFIVCLPFDVADPRAPEQVTQLKRWENWVSLREAQATAAGRTLRITRWDASLLKGRLTADDKLAGRILFWFGDQVFTPAWFQARLEKALADLGPRYSAITNIELPIRRALTAVSGEPEMRQRLQHWADSLDRAAFAARSHLPAVIGPCAALVRMLRDAAASPLDLPVDALIGAAVAAQLVSTRRLPTSRDDYEKRRILSALSDLLSGIVLTLNRPEWTHVNARRLLVTGEAGRGKSHLLADACVHQIARARPAVLLVGSHFSDQEIWGQVRAELDLPADVRGQDLLGALDAAGFAAGCRTLLVIDALNERDGQGIWPHRLAGLLRDAEGYPWVSVVLSCRSTYVDLVIPPALDQDRLPRLEHEGFATTDAEEYLESRGIESAVPPYPTEEFRNPLFLKTCCDGLVARGEKVFPRGSSGVSALFDVYASAIAHTLTQRLRLTPRQDLVGKAIAALAEEMAKDGVTEIPFAQADALTEAVLASGGDAARSLSFQLESEGVLVVEPLRTPAGLVDHVRFVFERFADHVVARRILESSAASGLMTDACRRPTALAGLISGTALSRPGVLEAVAVQIPETYGVELPDIDGVIAHDPVVAHAFRQSLRTREGRAFTARTLALAQAQGGADLVWQTLLTVGSEPDNPFNAAYLDGLLRGLATPERDGDWTVFLGGDPQAAEILTDWALRAGFRPIEAARAELAATAIAWLLTASHRRVRDRATKGLVALLADRGDLALSLWTAFAEVDDGYVSERVLGAVYGAALQGRWTTEALSRVARAAFDSVLATTSALTPNILTRDHARGLVHYAAHRAALPSGLTAADAEPPYTSAWPIESVPDATIAGFTRTYATGHSSRDEIVGSCVSDGDFARYVLDPAVRGFSPVRRRAAPLPTSSDLRSEWLRQFQAMATPGMLEAHQQLETELAAVVAPRSADGRRDVDAAKARFETAVGTVVFEGWREACDDWRARGMYQSQASRGPATFNLAWARRWVAWRAHQWGWSEALHGAFDLSVRNDRSDHEIERIGKKYQWLALYELRARAIDNLAVVRDEDAGEPPRQRNTDLSLLLETTEELGWSQLDTPTYWTSVPDLTALELREALAWRDTERDVLDGPENIEVIDPWSRSPMLVLAGFGSWRAPAGSGRRDMWRRICSMVVRRRDLRKALAFLAGRTLLDERDLPSGSSLGSKGYLGEHAWALAPPPPDDWSRYWARHWDEVQDKWVEAPVRGRGTTADYLKEGGGYDHALRGTIQAALPAPWLMAAMGLHLVDGREFAYANASGEVRFRDPSADVQGHSAALVHRAAFEQMLDLQDLACIWSVAGEKGIYGESFGKGFGGRVSYTRLYSLSRGKFAAHDRHQELERPSFGQLRDLY